MALKISAGGLFTRQYLLLQGDGVRFFNSSTGLGRVRRFRFGEIIAVLQSPDHQLSFQVGAEVFSLPVAPGKPKHQAVINALVTGVRSSTFAPGA